MNVWYSDVMLLISSSELKMMTHVDLSRELRKAGRGFVKAHVLGLAWLAVDCYASGKSMSERTPVGATASSNPSPVVSESLFQSFRECY